MNIQPMGERVLIKQQEKQEKTKGGIYIPDAAKEEKKQGTIKGVGTTKDGKELPLTVGDTVLYGGYSNEEVTVDGESYIIVEFKDVIAKLGE